MPFNPCPTFRRNASPACPISRAKDSSSRGAPSRGEGSHFSEHSLHEHEYSCQTQRVAVAVAPAHEPCPNHPRHPIRIADAAVARATALTSQSQDDVRQALGKKSSRFSLRSLPTRLFKKKQSREPVDLSRLYTEDLADDCQRMSVRMIEEMQNASRKVSEGVKERSKRNFSGSHFEARKRTPSKEAQSNQASEQAEEVAAIVDEATARQLHLPSTPTRLDARQPSDAWRALGAAARVAASRRLEEVTPTRHSAAFAASAALRMPAKSQANTPSGEVSLPGPANMSTLASGRAAANTDTPSSMHTAQETPTRRSTAAAANAAARVPMNLQESTPSGAVSLPDSTSMSALASGRAGGSTSTPLAMPPPQERPTRGSTAAAVSAVSQVLATSQANTPSGIASSTEAATSALASAGATGSASTPLTMPSAQQKPTSDAVADSLQQMYTSTGHGNGHGHASRASVANPFLTDSGNCVEEPMTPEGVRVQTRRVGSQEDSEAAFHDPIPGVTTKAATIDTPCLPSMNRPGSDLQPLMSSAALKTSLSDSQVPELARKIRDANKHHDVDAADQEAFFALNAEGDEAEKQHQQQPPLPPMGPAANDGAAEQAPLDVDEGGKLKIKKKRVSSGLGNMMKEIQKRAASVAKATNANSHQYSPWKHGHEDKETVIIIDTPSAPQEQRKDSTSAFRKMSDAWLSSGRRKGYGYVFVNDKADGIAPDGSDRGSQGDGQSEDSSDKENDGPVYYTPVSPFDRENSDVPSYSWPGGAGSAVDGIIAGPVTADDNEISNAKDGGQCTDSHASCGDGAQTIDSMRADNGGSISGSSKSKKGGKRWYSLGNHSLRKLVGNGGKFISSTQTSEQRSGDILKRGSIATVSTMTTSTTTTSGAVTKSSDSGAPGYISSSRPPRISTDETTSAAASGGACGAGSAGNGFYSFGEDLQRQLSNINLSDTCLDAPSEQPPPYPGSPHREAVDTFAAHQSTEVRDSTTDFRNRQVMDEMSVKTQLFKLVNSTWPGPEPSGGAEGGKKGG